MLLREFTLESVVDQAILFHKELNPKLWKERRLNPEVRFKLLKIATAFCIAMTILPYSLSNNHGMYFLVRYISKA